ncbi:MAG TPA: TlpA disulfide reductase family protein [Bryobacteraceae bacterium]|nr:TlpA disulfide reductase family protein [Bryobacteraceae bacterium]
MFLSVRAIAAGLLCLGLLLTGCQKQQQAAPETKVKPDSARNAAPEFALKDADGKTVTLAEYKGKVVLLNFWATWCGPCKIEIPWFADFEQKYKDRGFAVLGVAMDEEGWEVIKPYLAQSKVNYRVILGNDTVAGLYGGVESLPTTFVLDRNGKIASTHVGLVSKSDYENEIMQLLEGAKSSDARSAITASNRAAN